MLKALSLLCAFLLAPTLVVADSLAPVVVLANPNVAASVSSLPSCFSTSILESSRNECDQCINERALSARTAHFYVFDSRCESLRAAMFRERLANQGVKVIDLKNYLDHRHPVDLAPRLEPVIRQMETHLASINNP